MAAEDKDSRTEEPTQARIDKARKKGQFPKAEEINAVFLLIAFTGMLLFIIGPKSAEMLRFGEYVLENIYYAPVNLETAAYWFSEGIYQLVLFLSPFLVLAVISAIIAGGLQSGFRLSPESVKLSLEKLNPMTGLQRLFSLKSIVQGGVDVLKLIAVVVVIWSLIWDIRNDSLFHEPTPVSEIPRFFYENALWMFFRVILAMAVIAAIHYAYQRWQTHEDMKMTKQEVKDERKQQEGDPLVKRAQKQAAMRIARGQMLQAVPTADVVVTNPTHFAVALKYERGKDIAPIVVAKGKDLFAQRIKSLAKEHEVPIVENKPLARVLYRVARVNEAIPAELYQTVADILAYVYRTYRYHYHRLKIRRAQKV